MAALPVPVGDARVPSPARVAAWGLEGALLVSSCALLVPSVSGENATPTVQPCPELGTCPSTRPELGIYLRALLVGAEHYHVDPRGLVSSYSAGGSACCLGLGFPRTRNFIRPFHIS